MQVLGSPSLGEILAQRQAYHGLKKVKPLGSFLALFLPWAGCCIVYSIFKWDPKLFKQQATNLDSIWAGRLAGITSGVMRPSSLSGFL